MGASADETDAFAFNARRARRGCSRSCPVWGSKVPGGGDEAHLALAVSCVSQHSTAEAITTRRRQQPALNAWGYEGFIPFRMSRALGWSMGLCALHGLVENEAWS